MTEESDSLRFRRFRIVVECSKEFLHEEQTAYTHFMSFMNACVQCHNGFFEPQYTKFADKNKNKFRQ